MTQQSDELKDLFPTWFKKLQVTFSGQLPSNEKEREQVLVVPYAMFEMAIKALLTTQQQELLDRVMEQSRNYIDLNHDIGSGYIEAVPVSAIKKIREEL